MSSAPSQPGVPFSQAFFEAIAVAVELQDVTLVGKSVYSATHTTPDFSFLLRLVAPAVVSERDGSKIDQRAGHSG